MITRHDLEQDRIRRHVETGVLAAHMLSVEAMEASLQQALAARPPGAALWLFAYGSLIWNPMLEFAERRPALLHGFHRGFYLLSRINRGTPERPGLVLALERGGTCRGVAYRISDALAEQELRVLWRREMLLGSYHPRWLRLRLGEAPEYALCFVANRAGSGYAGRRSDAEVVDMLLQAEGLYGSGADYLSRTVEGLRSHGIRDRRLEVLWAGLMARRGAQP